MFPKLGAWKLGGGMWQAVVDVDRAAWKILPAMGVVA
jgi:hypothetical protein